jgi:hypothetical protein
MRALLQLVDFVQSCLAMLKGTLSLAKCVGFAQACLGLVTA